MITVTTPTGHIGRQLVARLLEADEPIRVIARDPSRLDDRVRERVEIVQGSHDDLDVLTEGFAGADSVFWLVPPDPGARDVDGRYLDFARPACEAIEAQAVRRVVAVSSMGRGVIENAGLLSAAFAMEEQLEGTSASLRTLAMPSFNENLLGQLDAMRDQGAFFMANIADRPLATIATRDIATTAAELLLDHSWSGQERVPVVGPDDLSPAEMADTISDVLQHPVRVQQIPLTALKETMVQRGTTEGFAQGMVEMVAAQNDGIYDAEHRASGSSPTSFRHWCEAVLKPAFAA